MNGPVVIAGIARTAQGGFQGALAAKTAPELGAVAIQAALTDAGVAAEDISETIMGCVLAAGQGQAPARQASLGAGIPQSVGATTVNKMCGSGMKAIMLGHDAILAGTADVIAAGGMESMTNAPYLLPKARAGLRMGHAEVVDHLFLDGLEDAYDRGRLMGSFAEATASRYGFSREQQDAFAVESLLRAQKAIADGDFEQEIAPVTITSRKGDSVVATDEQPGNAKIDKIPDLRPAFAKDGTVTAANSSSISDGAAALVLMPEVEAERRGVGAQARILAHTAHAHEPEWFTTAPVGAINKLLDKLSWSKDDVDLFEINEAFAVVTLAAMHDLELPHEKVNIRGGACALGHPIGTSGARIVVTLLRALQDQGLKRGIASLCIGGGEATAIAIEVIN